MYKRLLWFFVRAVRFVGHCAVGVLASAVILEVLTNGRELPFALEFLYYPLSPLRDWVRNHDAAALILIVAGCAGLALLNHLLRKLQAHVDAESAIKKEAQL